MINNFKIGDKVRVISSGSIGEITVQTWPHFTIRYIYRTQCAEDKYRHPSVVFHESRLTHLINKPDYLK